MSIKHMTQQNIDYRQALAAKGVKMKGCRTAADMSLALVVHGFRRNHREPHCYHIERFLGLTASAAVVASPALPVRGVYQPSIQTTINQERAQQAYSIGGRVLGRSI